MSGSWNTTYKFLEHLGTLDPMAILHKYGAIGVTALSDASPKSTGLMASNWSYEITSQGSNKYTITWHNNDIENGYNVAVLIQYGHGTRGGTFVQGRDFINPAMAPVMDKLADELWKEVTKL